MPVQASLPHDAPSPRNCHVKKSFPEEEYGFNLHAERTKGQFIGKVDDGSPAHRAGLRQGDRIIAVNGIMIANEAHKDVVRRIKEDPLQTHLLVIDDEGLEWYRDRGIEIRLDQPNIIGADEAGHSHHVQHYHEEPTKPPTPKHSPAVQHRTHYEESVSLQ